MKSAPLKNMVESGIPQNLSRSLALKVKKRGDWYHLVGRDPRNWRNFLNIALGTKNKVEALCTAGEIAANIKRGIEPKVSTTKIKQLSLPNLGDRDQGIMDKHIHPFFGELKPIEIKREHIEEYMLKRWGRDETGRNQAVENTWKKESRLIVRIMRLADPLWSLPKLDYKATFKEKLPPLTFEQIAIVGRMVYPKYAPVFWGGLYTVCDIIDVVTIAPCHLQVKPGWIIKERSKTSHCKKPNIIRIPLVKAFEKILKKEPRPLDPETPYYGHLNPKYASKEIRKAFTRAGFHGYGAKYLRRFGPSIMLDAGHTEDWLRLALAHAEGSQVTMDYPQIYDERLEKAFKLLDRKIG